MATNNLVYATPNVIKPYTASSNIKKLILCRGIQGSGKTTWAKQWVLEDADHRVRFNNDDVRNMLGKYWVPKREPVVLDMMNVFLNSAMEAGYDIVIDNMNLNPKSVEYIKKVVRGKNKWHGVKYEIEFKDFFIPLQDCIERDSKRPNPIGEEVIRKTYERYKEIIEGK